MLANQKSNKLFEKEKSRLKKAKVLILKNLSI